MFDCFDANETGRILLRCSMNTDIDIEINFFFYRDDAKIFDLDKRIEIIKKEKERKKKIDCHDTRNIGRIFFSC